MLAPLEVYGSGCSEWLAARCFLLPSGDDVADPVLLQSAVVLLVVLAGVPVEMLPCCDRGSLEESDVGDSLTKLRGAVGEMAGEEEALVREYGAVIVVSDDTSIVVGPPVAVAAWCCCR